LQGIIAASFAAVLLLVPVQCLFLPLNMSLADILSLAVLPPCWMWLLQARQRVLLPFLGSMWLLLLASGLATLTSLDPSTSAVAVAKEIYLYLWMVTFCGVLANVGRSTLRRLLLVWLWVALGHGALIVAQFVHPPLLADMNERLAGFGKLDLYRPSGLMENSNAAALFQLTAFVPLLALDLPAPRLLVTGSALLVMMLATGSMSTVLGFGLALLAGLVGLVVVFKNLRAVLQFTLAGVVGAALIAAVVAILMQSMPELQQRVEYVLTGRSSYSAEGRFAIWSSAADTLFSDLQLTGLGPDVYRELHRKELHNDFLSFAVERGLPGFVALRVFGAAALLRSCLLVRSARERGAGPAALVFPAALGGMLMVALTHEIFHQRPFWMVLALQEAVAWRLRAERRTPAWVAPGAALEPAARLGA
jgi:hypothetical protein